VACVRVRVREAYRIAVCGHEGAPSSLSFVRPSQSTQLGQSTTYRLAGDGQVSARIPLCGILAPRAHLNLMIKMHVSNYVFD
jgi:hypothetical protein